MNVKRIIEKFLQLFCIKENKKISESFIQFIKFGIVGISNTIVGYIVNILTILILQVYEVPWDYFAGNISAFIFGVLWSFYWNNKYVFKLQNEEKRSLFWALAKTYVSYAFTGLVLNNILSYFWIDIFGVSKVIAPLINMIIGVPINFVMNKLWAFKTK